MMYINLPDLRKMQKDLDAFHPAIITDYGPDLATNLVSLCPEQTHRQRHELSGTGKLNTAARLPLPLRILNQYIY